MMTAPLTDVDNAQTATSNSLHGELTPLHHLPEQLEVEDKWISYCT